MPLPPLYLLLKNRPRSLRLCITGPGCRVLGRRASRSLGVAPVSWAHRCGWRLQPSREQQKTDFRLCHYEAALLTPELPTCRRSLQTLGKGKTGKRPPKHCRCHLWCGVRARPVLRCHCSEPPSLDLRQAGSGKGGSKMLPKDSEAVCKL